MVPTCATDHCRPATKLGVCASKPQRSSASLEEVVADYQERRLPAEQAYLRHYRESPSLRAAIEEAAMARLPNGKRFSHQRRIPAASLHAFTNRLLASQAHVRRCQNFSALVQLLRDQGRGIPRIGALTLYDTAHRLGAYLGLSPDRVYLHAGVRRGAAALGLDHRASTLPKAAFPREFQHLSPEQIEDCLCIYKAALEKLALPSPPPSNPAASRS